MTYQMDPQNNHQIFEGRGLATTKKDLKKHSQSKHLGPRVVCKINDCNKTFYDKSGLRKHIKSKHEGIRYKCDECTQTFTTKRSLRDHEKTKHKGYKYKCKKCGKEYAWLNGLSRHEREAHPLGATGFSGSTDTLPQAHLTSTLTSTTEAPDLSLEQLQTQEEVDQLMQPLFPQLEDFDCSN